MEQLNKKIRICYAAVQFLYWAQNAVAFAFATFYMQGLGFSATVMGIILALTNLFGFLLPNLLGTLVDRGHIKCSAAAELVLAAEALAMILLLASGQTGMVTKIGFTAFLSLVLTANPLYTKICMDLQRAIPDLSYGNPRALGSVSFAVCAWGLGLLLERFGLALIPASALALTVLQAAALLGIAKLQNRLPAGKLPAMETGRPMARFLLENRRFVLLLLGVALIFAANNTINNFLYLIVDDLGGTERTLGALNAMIGLIEVPVMLLYARKTHLQPQRLLILSLVCFPLKLLAIWAARTTGELFAAFLLQTLSFALYIPAMVDYVNQVIPYEDSAKGQSLSGSMISLGTLAATLCSGIWLDALPVKAVLLRLAVLAVLGLPFCLAGIQKRQAADKNQ